MRPAPSFTHYNRMSHEDYLQPEELDALKAKFSTPPRETSEMTDLFEIDRLLVTQRQNDATIVKMKHSLQARLDLLEEAVQEKVSDVTVEDLRRVIASRDAQIEEMEDDINDLSAENLALQETKETKGGRNILAVLTFVVIVAVIAFVLGQYTAACKQQTQAPPTVTVQRETLESFVARESQSLTADERRKLIGVTETILFVHFDTPAEIREAFRYERRKAGIDSVAFDAFVEKWTAKVESMNIEENVEAVRQVYESLLSGLRLYNDISGEPVEGFFSVASPSIITPEATNGDEPVSPDVLPTEEAKETPPTTKTTEETQRTFRRR